MKSTALITLFDNENYGNRLQNYALQKSLEQYANVVSIKNKPRPTSIFQQLIRKASIAESIVVNYLGRKQRKVAMLRFNERHVNLSGKTVFCDEVAERSLKNYDLYCVGSDQIWNPHFGRTGMFNYLGFAERDRTFSYAASFGIDKIPPEHEEAVRKGLNHIKFISVREDAGKRIVEELTGRTDAQVHVDPTMLLTTQQWDEVAEKPKAKLPEKYLLTYFLGDVSEARRQSIEAKAKELGCEAIWLMDKKSPFYAIGPGHFVYLIKHARMVCTDSFHGSAFSFLYGRPMAIYDRKGGGENMSSRLETLAAKFSLQEQLVQKENLDAIPVEIDYSRGYVALEEEREKSKQYLDMVFEEAERAGLCK